MKKKWWHYQLFYWSLVCVGIALVNDLSNFIFWTIGAVGLTCYEMLKEEKKAKS